MKIDRFIQVDEEGYFKFDNIRVSDASVGNQLLKNIVRDDRGRFITTLDNIPAWIEAFDEPIVVEQVFKKAPHQWEILAPYNFSVAIDLASLCLDEWDRFHGRTATGIPFVFSRKAQAEFFNLVDSFDDESVTADGKVYPMPQWLVSNTDANQAKFWDNIYQTETPGWELEAPAAALKPVLPQLKLPRSRVLVLGCGSGNDAAYFAEQGHVVTGIDASAEAIQRAKSKYGHFKNIDFIEADVFNFSHAFHGQFDLVFEHTLYCAITPERRNELVKVWRQTLTDTGHLLGIFFTMDKRIGPPFGGSEWEIRERLKKSFDFLYWTRWRQSIEKRQGYELLVYARKR